MGAATSLLKFGDDNKDLSSIHGASSDEEEVKRANFDIGRWKRHRHFFPSNDDDVDDDEDEEEDEFQRPDRVPSRQTSTPLHFSNTTKKLDISSDSNITTANIEQSPYSTAKTFGEEDDSMDSLFVEEENVTEQESSSLTQADVRNLSSFSDHDDHDEQPSSLPLKTVIVEEEDTVEIIPVEAGNLMEQDPPLLNQIAVRSPSFSSCSSSTSSCSTGELTSESDQNTIPVKRKAYTVKHWNDVPEDVLLNWANTIPVTKRRRFEDPLMEKVIKKYLESQPKNSHDLN